MHKHHYCECQHDNIRFCKKCQRPYCLDCGREWYANYHYYTYTYPYYIHPTTRPYEITWGTTSGTVTGENIAVSSTVAASYCTHTN